MVSCLQWIKTACCRHLPFAPKTRLNSAVLRLLFECFEARGVELGCLLAPQLENALWARSDSGARRDKRVNTFAVAFGRLKRFGVCEGVVRELLLERDLVFRLWGREFGAPRLQQREWSARADTIQVLDVRSAQLAFPGACAMVVQAVIWHRVHCTLCVKQRCCELYTECLLQFVADGIMRTSRVLSLRS